MPPKKRQRFTQKKQNAKRVADRRKMETPFEAELRRRQVRVRASISRQTEIEEETIRRRLQERVRASTSRENETEEETIQRRMQERVRASTSRENKTEEETIQRLLQERVRASTSRENKTEEETSLRRMQERVRASTTRENETEEETSLRLLQERVRASTSRQNKTEEETSLRRMQERVRTSTSRENETEEETIQRILQERVRASTSRQNKTEEETSLRRMQERVRASTSRENETEEETIRRRTQERIRAEQKRGVALREMISEELIGMTIPENISVHNCGPMGVLCQFCNALHFQAEKPSDGKFNNCCHKGKIKLPTRHNFPVYLENIMTDERSPYFDNFKKKIRSYNSSISFASMGARLAGNVAGFGPYCFKVQGQVYHRTSHLHPPHGEARKFAQLYVLDPTQAVEERMNLQENSDCNHIIMRELATIMQSNPYAQAYKNLSEVEKEQRQHAEGHQLPMPKVNMVLRRNRHSDNRRYNLPTTNEVAMIFQNDDGEPPFERDIRIYPRNSEQPFINLNILSPNLDPMTYPIFYPNGEAGWQPNMTAEGYPGAKIGTRNKVTMLQYKIAQTAVRAGEFNPILHGGNLTQQWIVDSHLQVEANNLNFIRNQQHKLRSENYTGLMDYIAEGAAHAGVPAGKAVILPSSFQGSPRNMRERYNDAMAIVTKYGKPDIFCTFTCNPKWVEITSNLFPGQHAMDRPDLVARVFKIKLKSLLDDIVTGELFGKVAAWVYTIEFQKRGLPHAHILLILQNEYKFMDVSRVDNFISAEIPDSSKNPKLFAMVINHMIHGPCGALNPKSPCMEEEKCMKDFPKKFQPITEINLDGYPLYQRKEGTSTIVRGKPVDNRFVVPYNPFLLLKYDAHINVEACTSVKSVKYIYKYIYKGYDSATVTIRETQQQNEFVLNEVANHIDARYVSAPEGMWRLSENKMHDRSHAIIRLCIHLPFQQLVHFNHGEENAALARAAATDTTLTAWFKLNIADINARQYLYSEIPYHYVFSKGKWSRRQRGGDNILSRMHLVSPKDMERFCLRLLLLKVPGAKSFDDLKTTSGIVHATYTEAARQRNLLADDQEQERILQEASSFKMPRQLRQIFAFICIFCNQTNALILWNKFWKFLSEDFQIHLNEMSAKNKALTDIQDILISHGLQLSSFKLPDPEPIQNQDINMMDVYLDAEEATKKIATLNNLQREAFNQIRSAIEDPQAKNNCFYLDGPGGSGKTHLYNTLMSFVRGKGHIVLPHATTGIAAILLKGGRTVHSGFKLPVPTLETSTSFIRMTSPEAKILREAKIIIIDESTMMSCQMLRCIDVLLREITTSNRVFGGKVMLLGGDFRQTLPVVVRGSRTHIIEACIKSSPLWKEFVQLKLIVNMRSEGQDDFNKWLLHVGENKTQLFTELQPNRIEIPAQMICSDSIVTRIYGKSINVNEVDNLAEKVILTAKNKTCLKLNNEILNLLPGNAITYFSADSVISDEETLNFSTEFLNSQTPSGMPPHKLSVKVGAIVMLIRNLQPKKGLYNGTRMILKGLHSNFLDAEVLTGTNKGDRVFLPRIDLVPTDTGLPFIFKRRQFPIIQAFAMTINKSQGQSFNSVGIYLDEPVFAHGQLYVAFSRCRNGNNIKVYVNETKDQGKLLRDNRIFTRNIVYETVL